RALKLYRLPGCRARSTGGVLRRTSHRTSRAVLSLECADALLAGIYRSTSREPLHSPSGGLALLQLRRFADLGHALRHFPESAPLASPVWFRSQGASVRCYAGGKRCKPE